jgi:hypothetical protein
MQLRLILRGGWAILEVLHREQCDGNGTRFT